jgi:hypothetical protein
MLVRRADYLRSGPFGNCRVPSTEIADAAQGVAKVLPVPEQQQETAPPMPQPQSGSPMSPANASVLPSERTSKRAISLGFLCGPEEHSRRCRAGCSKPPAAYATTERHSGTVLGALTPEPLTLHAGGEYVSWVIGTEHWFSLINSLIHSSGAATASEVCGCAKRLSAFSARRQVQP